MLRKRSAPGDGKNPHRRIHSLRRGGGPGQTLQRVEKDDSPSCPHSCSTTPRTAGRSGGNPKKRGPVLVRKNCSSSNAGRSDQEHPEVILLDTMGELMGLYSLGTLVFVGGSLVPIGAIILSSLCFLKSVSSLALICFISLKSPAV